MVTVARPRVLCVPEYAESLGRDAVELARSAGLELDPWQALVLEESLGVRDDGRWAAFEVGVNVARQNGKGAILEARELAGLFLLGERLIIHSAHEFATSQEHFRRLEALIHDTPELHAQVRRSPSGHVIGYKHSHGEESIELQTGQRIVFKTRTKGGSRGFSSDCLILDEAMVISDPMHGAMMPTLRASQAERGAQIWYAGSAVDQEVHEHGVVWTRVRKRGLEGTDPALSYFEWSVGAELPSDVTDEMAVDEELWEQANPGLGIRITHEHMQREQRSMDPRTFAVELLGVGDYPSTDGLADLVISLERWAELEDIGSEIQSGLVFAFDVNQERRASIAAAGRRSDGLWHVEVLENRQGTKWLPDRLAELVGRHEPEAVVCDGYGPVASMIHPVEEAGVEVETLATGLVGQACGRLVDAVDERTLRHLGSMELVQALRAAKPRPLGDTFVWSRKNSSGDISPLVAVTLALSAAMDKPGTDLGVY